MPSGPTSPVRTPQVTQTAGPDQTSTPQNGKQAKPKLNNLSLSISYDDAFIAYINGHQVLRKGVDKGSGAQAQGFTVHEANKKFDDFPLRNIAKFLKKNGKNVIAIEGHNANLQSSDFSLHPQLLLEE